MKKLFAIVLATIVLAVAFVQWHSYRAAEVSTVSASQIFIHGTPVCVFSKDGNIMARVGQCSDVSREEKRVPPEGAPFHRQPGMNLPPGHPPVDQDMAPDGRRTVPI